MKKIVFLILFIFFSGSILPTGNVASAAPRAGLVFADSVMKPEAARKKKNKGYKKPKRKKFLGIFKRKSSCDCPKH